MGRGGLGVGLVRLGKARGCGGRFLPMQGVKCPIILPVEGVKSPKVV